MENDSLEELWEDLLSRQADQVRLAFHGLSTNERKAVIAHLRRMVQEPDWHPQQRLSAQAALDALADILSEDVS